MTGVLRLVAVQRASGHRQGVPANGARETALHVIEAGGLAAFADPSPRPRQRAKALRDLVRHRATLERLAAAGTVLPAEHDIAPCAEEELAALVAANAGPIAAAIDALAGRQEYQIGVTWDPAATLGRLAAGQPGSLRHAAARAEDERRRLGALCAARLAEAGLDIAVLPAPEIADVFAAAVLTPAGAVAPAETLDACLEALDAETGGALHLRVAGPLPAVSFRAIRLLRTAGAGGQPGGSRLGLGIGPALRRHLLRQATRSDMASAAEFASATRGPFSAIVSGDDAAPGLLAMRLVGRDCAAAGAAS